MVQVYAFTEAIADSAVRYQIMVMHGSAMVRVQQADAAPGAGNKVSMGSIRNLAAAMPTATGHDGLPATAAIVGCHKKSGSERLASRPAKRCGMAVYACVDLGDTEDVAADAVFGRVVRELDRLKVISTR